MRHTASFHSTTIRPHHSRNRTRCSIANVSVVYRQRRMACRNTDSRTRLMSVAIQKRKCRLANKNSTHALIARNAARFENSARCRAKAASRFMSPTARRHL